MACCSLCTEVPFGSPQRLQWYAWGQPADISDNVTSYYLLPETKSLKALQGRAPLCDRARFCTFAVHVGTQSLSFWHLLHTCTHTQWPVDEPTIGLIHKAGYECVCMCVHCCVCMCVCEHAYLINKILHILFLVTSCHLKSTQLRCVPLCNPFPECLKLYSVFHIFSFWVLTILCWTS